jgi:biotin carboxyl carrier protein
MKLRITVEGNTYDVDVEVVDADSAVAPAASAPRAAAEPSPRPVAAPPPRPAASPAPAAGGGGDKAVKSPIAGNITQVKVKPGDAVTLNQTVLVMEAMKMETNIASPVAGTVAKVNCSAGDSVRPGQVLIEFA